MFFAPVCSPVLSDCDSCAAVGGSPNIDLWPPKLLCPVSTLPQHIKLWAIKLSALQGAQNSSLLHHQGLIRGSVPDTAWCLLQSCFFLYFVVCYPVSSQRVLNWTTTPCLFLRCQTLDQTAGVVMVTKCRTAAFRIEMGNLEFDLI